MGFTINDNDRDASYKLYTGRQDVKVVAVNPTKVELETLGFPIPKEEPIYTKTTDDGVEQIRIDIYVEGDVSEAKDGSETVKGKIPFWLKNRERPEGRNSGKCEYVNIFGKTFWFSNVEDSSENPDFARKGIRRSFDGEGDLLQFIRVWVDSSSNDENYFEVEKLKAMITTGDVSTLRNIMIAKPNNKIKCLFGVKDGKYQTIYTGMFERIYSSDASWINNRVQKDIDEGRIGENLDYGTFPYEVKVWNGSTPTPTSDPVVAQSAPWSTGG